MIRLIRDRLRGLFGRERVIADIDDELQSHVALATEENMKRGMAPEEARKKALASFGNVGVVRDAGYDVRGGGWLEGLWMDFRFALRSLRRQRTVTAAALVTWALGIGAAIAVFSVVQPVLLKPLPFRDPESLVGIWETCLPKFPQFAVASGNFNTWRENQRSFSELVMFQTYRATLTGVGDPERPREYLITDGYFDLFGITPRLGRNFTPDEGTKGRGNVVILSDGLWQRRFAADPAVVGKTITIDDQPVIVVGVLPPGLNPIVGDADLWRPYVWDAEAKAQHGGHSVHAWGRLKPGVTIAAATADLDAIAKSLELQMPQSNAGWRVLIQPMNEPTVGAVRPFLVMLSAAVFFVLLIAGANVANLLIGRTAARERELAVRAALGAGRWRILRQLACESLLLSIAGGALGLLVGFLGVSLLLGLAPQGIGGLTNVHIDLSLCLFAAGLSAVVGFVVALAPARHAARSDLTSGLKEGHAGMVGRRHARLRRSLVIVEIAACLLLLINAGLLVRSLGELVSVDPGFRPENVLTFDLSTPKSRYPEDKDRTAFYIRLVDALSTLPGVRAVGACQSLPFVTDWLNTFAIPGQPAPEPGREPSALFYGVTPKYFETLGIKLVAGRVFDERDKEGAQPVAIVNEKIANQYYPGGAVGKTITFHADTPEVIVGVVADVKQYGLDRASVYQIYEPHAQVGLGGMSVVVRTDGDPASVGGAIRARVASLDPAMPIARMQPYAQIVADSLARQRFAVLLLGIFAGVALVLGVVGIYGVIADAITQRTREIGVRVALGASSGQVVAAMMRVGLFPALAGVVIGLGIAAYVTRFVASLLFGIQASDPLTWAGAAAALLLAAALASYIPARRATRIDPMVALRYD